MTADSAEAVFSWDSSDFVLIIIINTIWTKVGRYDQYF